MGSKTPEGDYDGNQRDHDNIAGTVDAGGRNRTEDKSQHGDGCLCDGGSDDDDDADDGDQVNVLVEAVSASAETSNDKKKKRKPRKKKSKKKQIANVSSKQTSPPRVPLSELFPDGNYPRGEIQSYKAVDENLSRTTAVEVRHDVRKYWEEEGYLHDYRKGGEAHRQARQWVHDTVKPGQTLRDIAEGIEANVRALLDNQGLNTGDCLKSGLAFPTGLCINHEVAHYTPNPGQKDVILKPDDVLTIDFGVHINGWIVDSAFTIASNPIYDNLLMAVKDATNSGIKTAGVDVRICEVSEVIQETMESYELEINGRSYPVRAVRDLTGHNIQRYRIHGGKSIPFVKNNDQTKMEEGEVFAIETFGSTGRARTMDDVGIYGYSLNRDAPLRIPVAMSTAKTVHKAIRENFGTLPFCRRYLERLGVERYHAGMNCLIANDVVQQYFPLMDVKGSYSAQFEHTFLLTETHKEVFSRGADY